MTTLNKPSEKRLPNARKNMAHKQAVSLLKRPVHLMDIYVPPPAAIDKNHGEGEGSSDEGVGVAGGRLAK